MSGTCKHGRYVTDGCSRCEEEYDHMQRTKAALSRQTPTPAPLKPCPLCGGEMRIAGRSGEWGAECVAIGCPMMIAHWYTTSAEVIVAANKRSNA